MPIFGRYPNRTYTPCPEGLQPAVCSNAVDLGEIDTMFGKKQKVRLAFEIAEIDPATQKRHRIQKTFTNSMHKRSTLRSDLESWRGRRFTETEAKHFDLESLIGVPAMLHVVHESGEDGTVYANVKAIMPLTPGSPKLTPDYVRQQTRSARDVRSPDPTPQPTAQPPADATELDDDADLTSVM